MHAVLEAFFKELHASGAGSRRPILHSWRARAARRPGRGGVRAAGGGGRTGHPLAWRTPARAFSPTCMRCWSEKTPGARQRAGGPACSSGRSVSPTSRPPGRRRRSPCADGRTVAFRGLIDRVDFSPPRVAPRRALIVDYKTGATTATRTSRRIRFWRGRHVQLALYARALRAALPPRQQPQEVHAEFRFVSAKGGFKRLRVVADATLTPRSTRWSRLPPTALAAACSCPARASDGHGGFDELPLVRLRPRLPDHAGRDVGAQARGGRAMIADQAVRDRLLTSWIARSSSRRAPVRARRRSSSGGS